IDARLSGMATWLKVDNCRAMQRGARDVTRTIKTQHDRCLPAPPPFSAMVREAAADWPADLFRIRGLPDATELELLVDFRSHPFAHARGPDRHRHRAGNALHPPC